MIELMRNSYKCESHLVFLVQMAKMQKKSMNSPDETRTFDKGKVDLTKIGDTSIGKMYLEPGWSWEKCIKPIAKTQSCQASHTQYVISGRIRFKMNDGNEEEYGPGDVAYIPPGHKAWVVGNESIYRNRIRNDGSIPFDIESGYTAKYSKHTTFTMPC